MLSLEIAKGVLKVLTEVARISLPAVAIGLLANQIVKLLGKYPPNMRIDPKQIRRVLDGSGFPIPLNRGHLFLIFPFLTLVGAASQKALELALLAAGSPAGVEIVQQLAWVLQALRAAYEDAVNESKEPAAAKPGNYVPSQPRQSYPGKGSTGGGTSYVPAPGTRTSYPGF